jgi:hypothetical protein
MKNATKKGASGSKTGAKKATKKSPAKKKK